MELLLEPEYVRQKLVYLAASAKKRCGLMAVAKKALLNRGVRVGKSRMRGKHWRKSGGMIVNG